MRVRVETRPTNMEEPLPSGTIWWSEAKRVYKLADAELRALPHERLSSRRHGVKRRLRVADVEEYVARRPARERKRPTCGCCGQPRVAGHAAVCQHTKRSCKRCSEAREAERAERSRHLCFALKRLGLERRADSSLCSDFEAGRTRMSAPVVAEVCARFRYFYGGFSEEFEAAWKGRVEEIERCVQEIKRDEGRYYTGIYADAIREVCGNGIYTFGEAKEDLAGDFPAPRVWPWIAARTIQRRWRAALASPYTLVGRRRLEREYVEAAGR